MKFTFIENEVTIDDIKHLRNDLKIVFDTSPSLLSICVRLVFSDCSGPLSNTNNGTICDGCIDINIANNSTIG